MFNQILLLSYWLQFSLKKSLNVCSTISSPQYIPTDNIVAQSEHDFFAQKRRNFFFHFVAFKKVM
jgi:hypothetical protein